MKRKTPKELPELTTIEVKFTCDDCQKKQLVEVRVRTHFNLSADAVPEGWKVQVDGNELKCWCPVHALNH